MPEPKRVAYGQHEVPDSKVFGVTERHCQEAIRVDLEHGYVGTGVGADHRRVQGAIVNERDRDFVGILNDMVIGEYVAVFCIDDDTRARALYLTSAIRREEPSEERVLR